MKKPHATIPRTSIRINVLIQILALGILLLAANYYSFNHYSRWDFSRSQKFALADQTKRVLKEFKKTLKVIVFFSNTSLSPETKLYPDIQNLLKELQFSARDKIRIEYVDITRDLTRARELQAQYKFSANENVLILDYEGRTKIVPVADTADFDLTPLERGDPPRLLAFKGEQVLTTAMIGLLNPEHRKVYFLQAHGEPRIDGPMSPLSVFREYIEKQNASTAPLTLSSADAIPADASALAIIAPQTDIDAREAAILLAYWQKDGRLLLLLDPKVNAPNLRNLLGQTGIMPRNDRVLRLLKNPLLPEVTGIWRTVTGEFLPTSAITKRLTAGSMVLPGPTQSLYLDDRIAREKEILIRPLIQAAEEFWGESEYITTADKGVRYDEGQDTGQPVFVAASASRGGVSDDRVEIESAKLVVVGNSEFVLDVSLMQNPAALDFLLSSANWLLDRGKLIGVVPKAANNFSLNLSDAQMSQIALYTMFVIPGVAALFGLIAWWRRRA